MKKLKILYLEDSIHDSEIVGRTLKNAGIDFSINQVDSKNEYEVALKEYQPDLILADHSLFEFNSLEALKIFKEYNLKVPFILVTGTVSEEFAVNILKEGADDYLLKDNLARLPNVVNNVLEKYRIDGERQKYLENIVVNEALLKEAEQMAHFGSWQADMSTGVIKWSDEAFRIYGYKPDEIVPDYQTFLNHIHPEDVEAVKKALEETVERLDSYECEFRIVNKSGKVKYISSKIVVKRNNERVPIRLVGFNQDITERKEAEKKLLESIKEVAQLEKELVQQQLNHQKMNTEITIQAQEKISNELGRELHDNINQILATVKMYLGMAKSSGQDTPEDLIGKSYEHVNEAMAEIRKLSHMLVAPSLGDIGLKDILQGLVGDLNLLNELQVQLFIDEKYNENEIDKTKELMLYRIVQEQLNNITKYAKANKAVITLKTDNSNLFLSVADNGVGFDTTQKGNGIGLKNIRSRVEFYSGYMNIISAPGKGCTLEVYIPR